MPILALASGWAQARGGVPGLLDLLHVPMVLPVAPLRLLLLASGRGGEGTAVREPEEACWIVAGPEPDPEGPTLRLPQEACGDPGLVSSFLMARIEPDRRRRTQVSLHPSLWQRSGWGPASLQPLLLAAGFPRVAILLDGSWEEERLPDLLALMEGAAQIQVLDGQGEEAGPAVVAGLPVPACLVAPPGQVLGGNPAWGALVRSLGPGGEEALLGQVLAGSAGGVGAPGGVLVSCRGRWFQVWRGPWRGTWSQSFWVVLEVTRWERELSRERKSLGWLERALRLLGPSQADPAVMASTLAREVQARVRFETVLVFRLDPGRGMLLLLGGAGPVEESWEDLAIPLGAEGPLTWVARSGRTLTTAAAAEAPPLPGGGGWRRCLAVPLLARGQVLGVLLAVTRFPGPLPARQVQREVETVCQHLAALLQAEELYRLGQGAASEWERIFHAVEEPILVLDKDARVQRANQTALRLAGLQNPVDLIGRPVARLLYGRSSPPRTCLIQQVLRSGRTASGFRTLPNFGGRFQLAVHPLPGPGGAPVGAVLIGRNVNREVELEGRFRGVMENANALFLVADPAGTIQFAAGVWETFLGLSPGEVQGRCFGDLVHPLDRDRVVEALAGLGTRPGRIRDFVYRACHRDGALRWHQVTGFSEADESNAPERLYLFISDVTELVRAREEAERRRVELRTQRDMLARLLAAGARFAKTDDLRQKLDLLCRTIQEAGLFRRAVLGVLEPRTRRLRVAAAAGIGPQEVGLLEQADSLLGMEGGLWEAERYHIAGSYLIPREARLPGETNLAPGQSWPRPDAWQPEDLLLVPLRGQEGTLLGVLVLDDPPDGQRPAEGTVRALEMLVQMAISAMEHQVLFQEAELPDGKGDGDFAPGGDLVAIVDREGRILRANPALAAFLDTTPAELRGRPAPALLHAGDRPGSDPLGETLLAGRGWRRRLVWEGHELRVCLQPWFEAEGEGRGRGAIWIGQVVQPGSGSQDPPLPDSPGRGESARLSSRLAALQSRLVFRLAAAEGGGERLLADLYRSCLETARLASRLENPSPGRPGPEVDLGVLLPTLLAKLEPLLPAGCRFETGVPAPGSMLGSLDPELFEELLANLVLEARGALAEGGALHVSLRPAGDRAILEVAAAAGGAEGERPPSGAGSGFAGAEAAARRCLVARLGGELCTPAGAGSGPSFLVSLPVASAGGWLPP